MTGSTLYTIGTALNHALDATLEVEVLVAGQWLRGIVVAVDAFGVVLASDGDEQAVIRMEAVSAVRLSHGAAPAPEIPGGAAHPMPGPRPSPASA